MTWRVWFRAREYAKGSLWLLPLLGVLVAGLAGVFDNWLEAHVSLPSSWRYSPSTASTLLATIAGALVALTGFVLTVSVLVVQMATNTFSARYMRLFYRDGLQKAVLAVLIGTLTFTLALLRHITSTTVPDVGVTAAAWLVILSLLLFVIFLNRFVHRLRPVAVAALAAQAGKRALAETEPASSEPVHADVGLDGSRGPAYSVHTPRGGALQAISVHGLVEWARSRDSVLIMRYPIGEFVPAGAALFDVQGDKQPTAIDERRLRGMVALGIERTIEQDPGFAVRIMVDIAIKALSAAINDPTTAVQAMNHLEDTLLAIGKTDLDRRRQYRDRESRVRLVVPAPTWSDYLTQGVTEIREYGATSVQVMRRLRAMLDDLRSHVLPQYRAAVDEEMKRLQSSVEAGFGEKIDLDLALLPDREGIGGPSTATSHGLESPAHTEVLR